MKKIIGGIWKAVQFFLALAVLSAIGFGVFLLLQSLLHEIAALNDSIVAAFVASLTAVFGYMYTQSQSKSKDIAESHRPKKIEICQSFMGILMTMMSATREGKPIETENIDKELLEKFDKINTDIILWGSPTIVKTWIQFREEQNQKNR